MKCNCHINVCKKIDSGSPNWENGIVTEALDINCGLRRVHECNKHGGPEQNGPTEEIEERRSPRGRSHAGPA
jgi:hypothetical protein